MDQPEQDQPEYASISIARRSYQVRTMPAKHEDRLSTLVRLLDEKTRDGVVFWEESDEEGVYLAAFGAYAVTVCKRLSPVDERAQEDIVLGIRSRDGKRLDELTDLEIESSLGDAYERMARIYQLARRQALGVNHAIENIIAQLNDSLDFNARSRTG